MGDIIVKEVWAMVVGVVGATGKDSVMPGGEDMVGRAPRQLPSLSSSISMSESEGILLRLRGVEVWIPDGK